MADLDKHWTVIHMVTVIIPTYNRAHTIKRSIRSVLAQTYSDIEVIVVDDCSTDNTKDIVESIEDLRLKYVRLNKKSGACVARNTGIELAEGEYIAFQDSDDEWIQNKLNSQIAAISKNNADVCFCQIRRYLTDGKKYYVFPRQPQINGFLPYRMLYEYSKVTTQTILCKKEVAKKYKFDPEVKKGQDYDWTLQAGKECSFYFLAEPLVNQYLQPNSITFNKNSYQVMRDMNEYFYQKYSHLYSEDKYMEFSMLKNLAYYKCLCGEKTSDDYNRIIMLSGKKKYLIGKLLGDTGLFHLGIKVYNFIKYERRLR